MKVRNGFVSNSSSCSYVVEFGKKIDSVEELKEVLNKDFWKDVKKFNKFFSEKIYADMKDWMTYDRICELIYKLMQVKDPNHNGKRIIDDFLDYAPSSLPTYPEFRASYLKNKENKYDREMIKSEYIDNYFYVEERIWQEFKRYYRNLVNRLNIEDLIKNQVELAYFSFGNESEYFGYDDWDEKEPREDWTNEENQFISELRNDDMARILFKNQKWARQDYS